MTGRAYVTGECGTCGRLFLFNARKVPTVCALGMTWPVCRECIENANRRRADRNLPQIKISPGAYEPEPS